MLDTQTKQLINSARDILVGKVPDPKSQIEQITLALIYKFMDDMDRETVEKLKGKPKFFAGDFAKYSWRNIFNPTLGGHEMLALYAEALEKMNTNPGIHPFFREIFKNAFLPYRSPETLKLFLKTINEFNYDHSENLGNAYEYLLSILGTQGDAGQFRTPRHIIDFIVKVIDPQKHETILDPACGTAGFLLAAYKHILSHNTSASSPIGEVPEGRRGIPGDKLTPDDRNHLATNLTGYDIDPNMERFALVNMFLHGFVTPQIHEYDTLSSQDRWNEYYDVILANPPFMSPKGGIRPHNRFSVKSNRSEVLFVDYIAEHLAAGGRAGIIVPEGIIFQSGTAYKSLRKMLVEENYLVGVISLPAGVFNPYSGVKTSILWLDKTLAKKTDKILFVKISSDGFDLGAQRRSVKENDLTAAMLDIEEYKKALLQREEMNLVSNPCLSIVEKIIIGKTVDYNLSGERYVGAKIVSTSYPLVHLGNEELFKIESGGTPDSTKPEYWNGDIKWITLVDLPAKNLITEIVDSQRKITEKGLKNSSAKIIPPESVIISSRATIGRIAINKVPLSTNQGFKNIIIKDYSRVSPKFLALMLTMQLEEMEKLASGGTFKEISKTNFSTLQVPLPPLSIQQELVSEIEMFEQRIEELSAEINLNKINILGLIKKCYY
jgi:type I restriction enzyme M protein